MHVMQFKHPGRFAGQDVFIEDWSDEEDDDAQQTIEQAEESEHENSEE